MSAQDELDGLDRRHAEAVEGRRRVDADEKSAYDAMRAAEAEYEKLLRQRLSGDEPPPKGARRCQEAARPSARSHEERVESGALGR